MVACVQHLFKHLLVSGNAGAHMTFAEQIRAQSIDTSFAGINTAQHVEELIARALRLGAEARGYTAEAIALKRELTELLSVEVDRAFAEQENVATAA
jgi:hypothetical protein